MRTALLLAGKDLRMLVRTRVLLALLVVYVVLIALILAGVLLRQGPPSVAYVNEDKTGDVVHIGDKEFSVSEYVHRAEENGVDVIETDRDEAERMLEEGQVAGVLVVPQGTVARLETQLSGAKLIFLTGDSPLGSVVAQRMRGIIYNINLSISDALIETNRSYLEALVTGGDVSVAGNDFDLQGLRPAADVLEKSREQLEADGADPELLDELDETIAFARLAAQAIGLADNALEAAAAPVRLKVEREQGKSTVLSAQGLSFALTLFVAFICLVLVAASLAGERDEAVLGRLLRGLASAPAIIFGKLLMGITLAVVLSVVLFSVYGIFGDQPWSRLPLLVLAAVLTSAACSGLGTFIAVLVRDARTATLVAILVVLPLVPLTLIGLHGPAAWVEAAFPVAHARELFNATLFDLHPGETVLRSGGALLAIAVVTSALSARLLRRLA